MTRGFVRSHDGKFITFDVPGGGTGNFQGTEVSSINDAGVITGYVTDPSGAFHGYLRSPHGDLSAIDIPGAGTATNQGTQPGTTNRWDEVVGTWSDANSLNHGFISLQWQCVWDSDR